MPESNQSTVEQAARDFIRSKPNARASNALQAILDRGSVTTRELNELGYDHPPRAIADAIDNGIPIKSEMIRADDGKRMARYRLGELGELRGGQSGRANFSKVFKDKIVKRYGEVDGLTGWKLQARALQIDHRVPFRIGGDEGLREDDVEAYMLLSASSQRAKSYSCESCENFQRHLNQSTCKTCYWAYPENYDHVAMKKIRRIDLVWEDNEVDAYDRIKKDAEIKGITLQALIKKKLS